MDEESIIKSTQYWLKHTVIGNNFCPFAKREFDNANIHYEVVDETNQTEQLHSLINELQRLDTNNELTTALVIYPRGLESFFDYLDFLRIADELLYQQNYEGVYQLASFHPDYCFEDVKQDDPSNYTNRSPYPVVHILRESAVENAIESYPNADKIPERNIQLAHYKGDTFFKDLLSQALKIK